MLGATHPLDGLKLKSFSELLALPDPDKLLLSSLLKSQPKPKSLHPEGPYMLISHDFKGNYRNSDFATFSPSSANNNDNNVETANSKALCDVTECFTMESSFRNSCDFFNYFSHNRITIPPQEWTACVRKQEKNSKFGSRCLGTIITEWEAGQKECDDFILFCDESVMMKVIMKLCYLCVTYNFDGYLVNIENPVENVPKMKKFVQLLRETLRGILGEDRAVVLWYDSVVSSGALRWQNTLNESNALFFEVSDGMFTNYQWDESKACDALEQIATCNERRRNQTKQLKQEEYTAKDVFLGTDVFGRGTYLGGGFNSHKAVSVALNFCMSNAIFAPGWLMEAFEHASGLRKPASNNNNNNNQSGANNNNSQLSATSASAAATGTTSLDEKTKRQAKRQLAKTQLESSRGLYFDCDSDLEREDEKIDTALHGDRWVVSRRSFNGVKNKFWDSINKEVETCVDHRRQEMTTFEISSSKGFATTFCASAGTVFSVFGQVLSRNWCQQSAYEVSVVPLSSYPLPPQHPQHQHQKIKTNEFNTVAQIRQSKYHSSGCFFGNGSLTLPLELLNNKTPSHLCYFSWKDGDENSHDNKKSEQEGEKEQEQKQEKTIVVEIVVSRLAVDALTRSQFELFATCPETSSKCTMLQLSDNVLSSCSFVLEKRFVILQAKLQVPSSSSSSSRFSVAVGVDQFQLPEGSSHSLLSSNGMVATYINIGYLRVASISSSPQTQHPAPFFQVVKHRNEEKQESKEQEGEQDNKKKEQTTTSTTTQFGLSVSERTTYSSYNGSELQVWQLSSSRKLQLRVASQILKKQQEQQEEKQLESVAVVLLASSSSSSQQQQQQQEETELLFEDTELKTKRVQEFCGYIFQNGCFLKTEIPAPQQNEKEQQEEQQKRRDWALVERFTDGSIRIVEFSAVPNAIEETSETEEKLFDLVRSSPLMKNEKPNCTSTSSCATAVSF